MPGWQQGPWPTSQPLTNGLAIAALVVGIVGACFGLIPLSFFLALPLGILGLIFGIVSWRKARRGAPRKGMAISGVVLGAVAITLGVIGAVIVNNAVDDLKDTFDDLGPADEGDFEVSLTSCGPNDSGYGEATGVIENTSNREQNFWITIYFVQNGTRVGQADDYIQDLGSGDSAQFEARGFDEVADSAECEVNVE